MLDITNTLADLLSLQVPPETLGITADSGRKLLHQMLALLSSLRGGEARLSLLRGQSAGPIMQDESESAGGWGKGKERW